MISAVALSCGGTALAQTNNVPAANAGTSGGSTNVTQLGNITVVGKLDQARDTIIPDLGATAHTFSKEQLETLSQGDNAPFNEVILRAPGVAEDSAANGDLHVRGEHANLQYRINDVLLPEGISGFGLELDPRFVDSMQLITGSLPAAYGFRTAGVVDIQTKSGAFENGGEAEMYGGSYDTVRPSFEYGGSEGKWSYFVDGSYDHNDLGIENPTASHERHSRCHGPIQDVPYLSYILDDTSRVSFMGSASYSNFQVPDTPGVARATPHGIRARCRGGLSAWPVGDQLQFRQSEREPKRAKLLRRRDLPEIGGRLESIKSPLSAATAACISRPIRLATFTSTAWPATWIGTSIPAASKPTPVTNSTTSTRFVAA